MSPGTKMRSNVREVAQRRMVDVESFLRYLFTLSSEICHCDLVYTFFHLILRDSNIHNYIGTEDMRNEAHRNQCEVYLKIQFNGNKHHSQLSIFVGTQSLPPPAASDAVPQPYTCGGMLGGGSGAAGHVKHLALLATGQAPDVYVKSYIRPDPQNLTKRKTQMYYENVGGEHVLSTRVLEVSVWDSAGLMDSNKLYFLFLSH
ncbi:unnamed protein product [Heligmosomoides polygyrus]|uniref:C2 domain-containing protein n=1 Tax=Heligmosomoides polygyrus TaxID=6339 RepID=A0A3P8EWR2_HELPZ|nr:unnamed protein product [Heligmosomoides polygyrus]